MYHLAMSTLKLAENGKRKYSAHVAANILASASVKYAILTAIYLKDTMMGLMEDLKNRASMIENFAATGKLQPPKKPAKKKAEKKTMEANYFAMDNKKTVKPYVSRYGKKTKEKQLTRAERRAAAMARKD